jgi:hypothetical protein
MENRRLAPRGAVFRLGHGPNAHRSQDSQPDAVRAALEHAQKLTEADDRYSTGWSHAAMHVGDLSVLALALPTRR